MSKAEKDAAKEAEKLAEKQKDLADSYDETKQDAADALFDLEQKHDDFQKGVADKIDEVRSKLRELRSSYEETANKLAEDFANDKASDRQGIAADIVAQEQKIMDLRKAAAAEDDPIARSTIEGELAKEQAAYDSHKQFILGLEAEVAEERRRAALTEFERQIEDYLARRAQAEQEYQDNRADALREYEAKKAELKREKDALQDQAKEEERVYQEKHAEITRIMLQAEVDRLLQTLNTHNATIALIDQQIDKYKQLAEAIKRASQGRPEAIKKYATGGIVPGLPTDAVPIIAHGGERVIPSGQRTIGTEGGINITVNYPQFKSEDDMRTFEKQLERIMREVELNYRT